MPNATELKRPKVGIHCPYPLQQGPDGVPNHILQFVPYLRAKGFEVKTLGPNIKNQADNLADIPIGKARKAGYNKTNMRTSQSFNLLEAVQLHRKETFDVLDLHEPFISFTTAMLLQGDRKGNVARVGHFHAQAEQFSRGQRTVLQIVRVFPYLYLADGHFPVRVSRNVINYVSSNFDVYVAVTHATEAFAKKVMRSDNATFDIVGNGIETSVFTPDGPKAIWAGNGTNILFAGRWDERKGIPDLLEAFAQVRRVIPDARLKLTGNGEMRKKVLMKIDELDLWKTVDLLGILPLSDLAQACRSADLFVAPSIGGEGWGISPVQALASGTLLVTTDIDGFREAFGQLPFMKNEAMAQSQNPHDLARKMLHALYLSKEEKARRREQGRKFVVDNHAWPIVTDKMVAVYENALQIRRDKKHGEVAIFANSGTLQL